MISQNGHWNPSVGYRNGDYANPNAVVGANGKHVSSRLGKGLKSELIGPTIKQTRSFHKRNGNYDEGILDRYKVLLPIDITKEALLKHEDLNGDGLITVDDRGPKSFILNSLAVGTSQEIRIKGNYPLSNLLQELFLAKIAGEKYLEIETSRLTEDPVHRIERLIKGSWWDNLTRSVDISGIARSAKDAKVDKSQPRIYIPRGAPEQHAYYTQIAGENPEMRLDVQWLPQEQLTSEFIKSLNDKSGTLALEMEEDNSAKGGLKGLPFVVPGGRFNELYNWDSCFCAWGMLETHSHVVKSVIRHFAFEIKHYGKVLNANRSYYLGRAQPPFLTDLALRTYEATRHEPDSKDRLKYAILAAMKEYRQYWMTTPRYDEESGLTRYRPIGAGFPPECEPTQFDHIIGPYAEKYSISVAEYTKKFNAGEIEEPDLDIFCLHDRAVRECGHDTSNRVEGVCADLAMIDLQCLLYKYETDIENVIRTVFDDRLEVPMGFCAPGQEADRIESSAFWDRAAKERKYLIDKYCWNEEKGMYFDYNTVTQQQTTYETVTSLWPLWCGVASPHQAALLVEKALPRFECIGGLSSTTEKSRGIIDAAHPQKQWDFPFGWAPHQMLVWDGLKQYGYHEESERLTYRWLHMIIKVFVDYNGAVVEKYDVTRLQSPHKVDAEYGNQGLNFKYAPEEGFGWTNASIIHGLSLLSLHAKRALGVCAPYETYAKAAKKA